MANVLLRSISMIITQGSEMKSEFEPGQGVENRGFASQGQGVDNAAFDKDSGSDSATLDRGPCDNGPANAVVTLHDGILGKGSHVTLHDVVLNKSSEVTLQGGVLNTGPGATLENGVCKEDAERCVIGEDNPGVDKVCEVKHGGLDTQGSPLQQSIQFDEEIVTRSARSGVIDEKTHTVARGRNIHKWLVLVAVFSCRMMGEGYAISMGVYFPEFLEYFQSGRGVTGWVVSLTIGIMYGAGIPISYIVYKTNERICCVVGGLLSSIGLITSYFAPNIIALLVTFGGVTGIGMALIQISYVIAIGKHFSHNQGPATAACEMGVTVGGLVFPLLLRHLIDSFGWRGAVLISGGILLNMVAMGILFGQPRKENATITVSSNEDDTLNRETEMATKYCNKVIKKTRLFIVYLITVPVIGLGCYFPYTTIVDIGTLRGFSKEQSTYFVIILSAANTVGVLVMAGLLKLFPRHSTWLFTINTLLLGASLYIFPFAPSYGSLVLAVILYGIPCGGLYGTYAIVVIDLLGPANYTTGLGFTCSGYGIGIALSTPVAGWISDATGDYEISFYIAGGICIGGAVIFGLALLADNIRPRKYNISGDFQTTN